MPDLFDVIWRWRKQVFLLVLITVIITTAIVFVIPKKYSSTTTALPAASYSTDKTSVFSQNLQNLYSTLGVPDDLDKVVGTAHLDTVYRSVIDQLNVAKHFENNKTDRDAVQKAAGILKKHTKVFKSDYGELKVRVWDIDKNLAAELANAIMEKLQQIYQDVLTSGNLILLSRINEEYSKKKIDYEKLTDSLQHSNSHANTDLLTAQRSSLLQQIQEYEKLMSQYKLMAEAKPQPLIIVERATPAIEADEPRLAMTIIVAVVLSLIFGLLTVLVLERKNLR